MSKTVPLESAPSDKPSETLVVGRITFNPSSRSVAEDAIEQSKNRQAMWKKPALRKNTPLWEWL